MSMLIRVTIVVALTAVLGAVPVAAQASTVSIATVTEGNSRVPLTSFNVSDEDYPLPSLVSNEEGQTVLTVVVDTQGRVTDAKIKGSSGYRRLDEAALQIAKSQWVFWPKQDHELPSPDTLTVNVDWILPFDGIPNDRINPPPAPSMPGGEPPQMTAQATVDDYPEESIRNKEQGTAKVRILVKEDGNPGEVEVLVSSGIPRLDEAARQMILKRWRYRPARFNGVPMETANVKYRLLLPAMPSKECRQEPVLANERVPRVSLFGSLTLRRQVLTDEEGLVRSALLLTQKGWMRLQPSVQDLRQPIPYYPRPTKNGAPAKCWYDADVTVKVR